MENNVQSPDAIKESQDIIATIVEATCFEMGPGSHKVVLTFTDAKGKVMDKIMIGVNALLGLIRP